MKNSLFRGFHIDKDGGFSTLITPEGAKKMRKSAKTSDTKKTEKIQRDNKEKEVNVSLSIVSIGDRVVSRKTASDSEPAETIVALVRSLVGMVSTTAKLYSLDPIELMDKAQRMIEEEFNAFQNHNE